MSTIPQIIRERLEATASQDYALQHPNFDVAALSYHLPQLAAGQKFGSWSLDGLEFEFRVYGQLSAEQTFLGHYGDMMYHKTKARYSGPWVLGDALRAKKKISLVLPDSADCSPEGRTLARQYEHLRDLQLLNFKESTIDLPVQARNKADFVYRFPNRWRISCVSENIFVRNVAHAQDAVPFKARHDPRGIIGRLVPASDSLYVQEPALIDGQGKNVPTDILPEVFRAGYWVEVYCKLRVWVATDGAVQTRSYSVVFDAVQFLCKGSLKEVSAEPVVALKRKREFEPVDSPQKRPRGEHSNMECSSPQ